MKKQATFRFYEELNDFLPADLRKVSFVRAFTGTPSVKDTIEAIGAPHTEIDLILVDGVSVGFDHLLRGGERVAVYPVFERLDISPVQHLRPAPLRETRFVLDVHLGKLARYLRLLGFDTLYAPDYDDASLARISSSQRRIVLTRDKALLKRREITHGRWLRHSDPREQLEEAVAAFDLGRHVQAFSRCLVCNHSLESVAESLVRDQLPPRVRDRYASIARCAGCGRLYWPGSHYDRLLGLVRRLLQTS